jgi:hypothetical protein
MDLLGLMEAASPQAIETYTAVSMVPGKRVTWTARIDETLTRYREGTVWSDGPRASTWWVVQDSILKNDNGAGIVIKRAAKGNRHGYAPGELFEDTRFSNWREGIRRAEYVRRHGVYAVTDGDAPRMHTDTDCSEAKDMLRYDEPDWDVWRVVDILVGRTSESSAPLCKRCIMFW